MEIIESYCLVKLGNSSSNVLRQKSLKPNLQLADLHLTPQCLLPLVKMVSKATLFIYLPFLNLSLILLCFVSFLGDLLYVVDSNLKRLLSLECVNDPEDGWKFQIAGPLIHPNHFPLSPRDIVVDFAGIILIADAGKEAIYMYRPDGAPLRCIKRIGETRLNWPIGMTVMNAGFVAILENNGTYKVA